MKTANRRVFAVVSGLLVVALVLLTQSWSRVSAEKDQDSEQTENNIPSLSAPAEAIPVQAAVGVTACFSLIAELTDESSREEELPPAEYFPAARFLRLLAKAFVSPNAP